MRTQPWAIALAVFVSFLTATGAFFLRMGASRSRFVWPSPRIAPALLVGVCLYGVASLLYLLALRGGEVSVLFPIVSLEYVWASLAAAWRLNERINSVRALGLAAIVLGAALIGLGSR